MTQKHKVIWAPQEGSQISFLTCPAFEVLYHSNRGPGKTDSLLMDFAQHIGNGFGEDWVGVIFRRTYPELKYLINASRKWFPKIWPDANFNIATSTWEWPDGEKLSFRPFLNKESYWDFHGQAFPWIGWDELCTWKELGGYSRMISCCRSTNPDVPRKIRSTTNPYGPNHNNVKHHFHLPERDGQIIATNYSFEDPDTGQKRTETLHRVAIKGYLRENKILLRAQPTYELQLEQAARNDAERKAWIDGSWDIVAGGMFDDLWKPDTHIVNPFQIPPNWGIKRAFDWGSSAPFSVGWWASSDGCDLFLPKGEVVSTVKGDLYRIAEWYGWTGEPNEGLKLTALEIAKGIVERELSMGLRSKANCRVRPGPADSSIWNEENGQCIAREMARDVRVDNHYHRGAIFTKADRSPNSRVPGWEELRQRMKNSVPEEGLPRESPGIFIFRGCQQFIRTVPVLSRSDKNMDDVDTDTEDHVGDETRYTMRDASILTGFGKAIGDH